MLRVRALVAEARGTLTQMRTRTSQGRAQIVQRPSPELPVCVPGAEDPVPEPVMRGSLREQRA